MGESDPGTKYHSVLLKSSKRWPIHLQRACHVTTGEGNTALSTVLIAWRKCYVIMVNGDKNRIKLNM